MIACGRFLKITWETVFNRSVYGGASSQMPTVKMSSETRRARGFVLRRPLHFEGAIAPLRLGRIPHCYYETREVAPRMGMGREFRPGLICRKGHADFLDFRPRWRIRALTFGWTEGVRGGDVRQGIHQAALVAVDSRFLGLRA